MSINYVLGFSVLALLVVYVTYSPRIRIINRSWDNEFYTVDEMLQKLRYPKRLRWWLVRDLEAMNRDGHCLKKNGKTPSYGDFHETNHPRDHHWK